MPLHKILCFLSYVAGYELEYHQSQSTTDMQNLKSICNTLYSQEPQLYGSQYRPYCIKLTCHTNHVIKTFIHVSCSLPTIPYQPPLIKGSTYSGPTQTTNQCVFDFFLHWLRRSHSTFFHKTQRA